jgi:hypothetical protein
MVVPLQALMQFKRDQQRDYSLTTVPCIGILRRPKMPESSKMTWNNYRSGKETGNGQEQWWISLLPQELAVCGLQGNWQVTSFSFRFTFRYFKKIGFVESCISKTYQIYLCFWI